MAIIRVRATQTLSYDNGYQPAGTIFNIGREEDFAPHCMEKVDPKMEPTDLTKVPSNVDSMDAKGRAGDMRSAERATLDRVAPPETVDADSLRKAANSIDTLAPMAPQTADAGTGTGDQEVI